MTSAVQSRHRSELETLIRNVRSGLSPKSFMNVQYVQWLCQTVEKILQDEDNLLEISGPIFICGDIHGHFKDLVSIFSSKGYPPETKYIFLGDYVDRGSQSVETITFLFSLKVAFRDSIFLLRGNHESREMTNVHGFFDECKKKLGRPSYFQFCNTFHSLPVAAVINSSIFCVHGGISPVLSKLDDIRALNRFQEIPESGLLSDLVWSDPNPLTKEWGPSDRGETFLWGLSPAKKFMGANGIKTLVRAHQVVPEGVGFPFIPDRSIVTVFSASRYSDECANKAAVIFVSDGGELSYCPIESIPKISKLKLKKCALPDKITSRTINIFIPRRVASSFL